MSSFLDSGKLHLKIDESSEEEGYPFTHPDVFLEGISETYVRACDFDWSDESVIVVRNDNVTTYTKHNFSELLAEDENGNVVWIDGRGAPCEGCWGGKYLGDSREATEYSIYDYNVSTKKKRKYKAVLEEEAEMDDADIKKASEFVDAKNIQKEFEIEDGCLKRYNGSDVNVVIPDTVKKIKKMYVFNNEKKIKSLTIPNSTVEICDFYDFSSLGNLKV